MLSEKRKQKSQSYSVKSEVCSLKTVNVDGPAVQSMQRVLCNYNLLRRMAEELDMHSVKMVYHACLHAHLSYGTRIWGH